LHAVQQVQNPDKFPLAWIPLKIAEWQWRARYVPYRKTLIATQGAARGNENKVIIFLCALRVIVVNMLLSNSFTVSEVIIDGLLNAQ